MNITQEKILKPHPTSQIFPPMGKKEYEEFKQNIKDRGLLTPIVMYEGMILDGNHRYKACIESGIEPKFTDFANTTITAIDFVISHNLTRRHLTIGQLAAVGAIILEKKAREFSIRRKEGKVCGRGNKSDVKVNSLVTLSKEMNVSKGALNTARFIKKRDEGLFQQLMKGEISLNKAFYKVNPEAEAKKMLLQKGVYDRKVNSHGTHFDREAKRVIDNSDLCDIAAPPSVYASDYEIWVFDKYLKRKGFNLCLNRVGDNFEAVYSKSESSMHGFPTYKAAIIAAGKAALETENHETTHNPKKN